MVAQALRGQKAYIFGWNAGSIELVKYFLAEGSEPTIIYESKPSDLEERLNEAVGAASLQVNLLNVQEAAEKITEASFVVVAEPRYFDAPLLEKARSLEIAVYTDLEFVSLHIKSDAKFVSVVGTNGKRTATHLLAAMLEASGKKVFSACDKPLTAALNQVDKKDFIIVPTSCFQLEGIQTYKPEMVIFLNIAEDHADKYPNYETYVASFREVLSNADDDTTLILNSQDPLVINYIHSAPGQKLLFGTQPVPEGFEGAWTTGDYSLSVRLGELEDIADFDLKNHRLRGMHNRENLMAAVLAALKLGVNVEQIRQVIDQVRTLKDRLQFIKRINSVAFYNDAASSNPSSLKAALHSFKEPIILISGGRDRGLDFSSISPSVRQRVKNMMLVGEAKENLNRSLGDFTETFLVGTVEEAVIMAYQKSRVGDVVLFSPGCDFNDAFKSIGARGEAFSSLVLEIDKPRRPNVI